MKILFTRKNYVLSQYLKKTLSEMYSCTVDIYYPHTIGTLSPDLIVMPGGTDISPLLYGESAHRTTCFNLKQDMEESKVLRQYDSSIPKIGICRGAQFLNIFNGGSLWQDVNNHKRPHSVECLLTGERVQVSSTHHQMMIEASHADILAIASESTQKSSCNSQMFFRTKESTDIEVLWYSVTKSLCVQFHPEYTTEAKYRMGQEEIFQTYVKTFIEL